MNAERPLPPPSQGIIILGMHRSGTSAITRGVQALGADLGDNPLETRFDNPTGYWEDKAIVEMHDRFLATLGMTWEDAGLIADTQWSSSATRLFVAEARHYLTHQFLRRPIWAFKDPRTLRLLPLWRAILAPLNVKIFYLLVLRNPLSVAASLNVRQPLATVQAHRLWLAYLVPQLAPALRERFWVVDFDLFMEDPRVQLDRLAARLELSPTQATAQACEDYLQAFLEGDMRHQRFAEADLDNAADLPKVAGDAYRWLHRLAADELTAESPVFQEAWAHLQSAAQALLLQ